jgi:hypothetical protein
LESSDVGHAELSSFRYKEASIPLKLAGEFCAAVVVPSHAGQQKHCRRFGNWIEE